MSVSFVHEFVDYLSYSAESVNAVWRQYWCHLWNAFRHFIYQVVWVIYATCTRNPQPSKMSVENAVHALQMLFYETYTWSFARTRACRRACSRQPSSLPMCWNMMPSSSARVLPHCKVCACDVKSMMTALQIMTSKTEKGITKKMTGNR